MAWFAEAVIRQSIVSDDGMLNVGFCFVCVGHAGNDLIPDRHPRQLGLSVLMAPNLIVFIVRAPRSATLVDSTGIRIRGITHTRRVAWQDVQDIRDGPLRGADGGLIPRVIAYAYLTGGRRKLVKHPDDKDYEVDARSPS
ncbi:hypothetical protein GCM10010343_12400 [Streptomyces avidinii]|nr:hypothetical protein GCM10010343_12400 [Streptomyces avidinii]